MKDAMGSIYNYIKSSNYFDGLFILDRTTSNANKCFQVDKVQTEYLYVQYKEISGLFWQCL